MLSVPHATPFAVLTVKFDTTEFMQSDGFKVIGDAARIAAFVFAIAAGRGYNPADSVQFALLNKEPVVSALVAFGIKPAMSVCGAG